MSFCKVVRHHSGGEIAVAVILILITLANVVLAYIAYGQFGWRVYSKLACDMRTKDARSRRKTYMLINIFTTLLKLDALVSILFPLIWVGQIC